MNTTSALTADASLASEISKLLLLRAAVGDGIVSPIPWAPYMVFSSALPDAAYKALVDAAVERYKELGETYTWPVLNEPKLSLAWFTRELKLSKRESLCFMDKIGTKVAATCGRSALDKYLRWSLEDFHNYKLDRTPKFLHFSNLPYYQDILRDLRKRSRFSDCIVIPQYHLHAEEYSVTPTQIKELLASYFEKGGTNEKVTVEFETPELSKDWNRFLGLQCSDFVSGSLTNSTKSKLHNMTACASIVATAASHAAQVLACLEQTGATSVTLARRHLDKANTYADLLFGASSGVAQRGIVRPAPPMPSQGARLEVAKESLKDSILLSCEKKISHKLAIRTPGVTAGLLEILVAAHESEFLELAGVAAIKMGKTKRAYILNPIANA